MIHVADREGSGGGTGFIDRSSAAGFLRAMREGASTHVAAERFGIAIAAAVRWRAQDRSGRAEPLAMGGDRRSGRIEAEAEFRLRLIGETDDITLMEMQRRLEAERGLKVGVGTLWRFFDRHGQISKMPPPAVRPRTPGSKAGEVVLWQDLWAHFQAHGNRSSSGLSYR